MPGFGYSGFDRRHAAMVAAWSAHYRRKGASSRKAAELARKKTHTWPPAVAGQ
jgi:hypothetical protein